MIGELQKIGRASKIAHEKGYIVHVYIDTFRHRISRLHVIMTEDLSEPLSFSEHFETANEFLKHAEHLKTLKENKITRNYEKYWG